jgi:hypothetical protein
VAVPDPEGHPAEGRSHASGTTMCTNPVTDGTLTILAFTTQVVQFDGTPIDPADDEVIDFSLVRSVGRDDTFDRDFCTDMKAFLG